MASFQALQRQGFLEMQAMQGLNIYRDKTKEAFWHVSGEEEGASWRTIRDSRPQMKVLCMGVFYWMFGSVAYILLANVLVSVSFNRVDPNSPSYPGNLQDLMTKNATQILMERHDPDNFVYRRELWDVGFALAPDLSSPRPMWGRIFADAMVVVSQAAAPVVLIWTGRTQCFVCYAANLMCLTLMKGFMQLATILPPANKGEYCWVANYTPEKLNTILHEPFSAWAFTTWGSAHGCNDMLWSGHTAQTVLGFLFLNKALGRSLPVRLVLAAIFVAYMLVVLSMRMHYTIDIAVAFLVALMLYTHTWFRFLVWYWSNVLVGNPKQAKEDEQVFISP